MILAEARYIFDATEFAKGLVTASRGIVRVQAGTGNVTQAVATGWLVTDDLVVVPAFALTPEWTSETGTVSVVPAVEGSDAIPAKVEFAAPRREGGTSPGDDDSLESSLPILLRLERRLEGQALQLAVAAPRPPEPVFLLHHPQGAPALMVSWGRLIGLDGAWIRYDADTEPGSGGAPVFSATWQVLGMHTRSSSPNDPNGRYNAGVSSAALLERLQAFDAWHEIAAHHGLADVSSARQEIASVSANAAAAAAPPDDDDLLGAAVSWTIDPATVPEGARERLATMVVDRSAEQWMLRGNERTRLMAGRSIDDLRTARGKAAIMGEGPAVIDRILAGPPFDLDAIDEAALPLWLQAVRWFAGIVPDLPAPGAIHRSLARRRIRSRLTEVAGPGFRGRKAELAQLGAWMEDPSAGLTAITGIGGVGKSALVAKLALDLPPDSVLLWLDFDRADLAPDDPVSVLTIVFEQLALEVPGVTLPPVDKDSWESALAGLGSAVGPAIGKREVVLVLDGFEVAQHAVRHEDIWGLLQRFLDQLPQTNVIVSGRAPLRDVEIAGRKVRNLHLEGLQREDAEAWLRDAGVTQRAVLDPVLDLCRGVPLILRLAVGWIQAGGKVSDLPDELPDQMVEGFLYRRILDRVVDKELKPVARDILVLRQLTPKMLKPIVGDSMPKGSDPADVFARLAQEMALVGDSGEAQLGPGVPVTVASGPDRLVLRPEVRAATLHLLETGKEARRVKTIDRRAAKWYAEQPFEDDPALRAELVYHRLRIGDLKGAMEVWDDKCLAFLVGAADDLPPSATRTRSWLRKQFERAAHDPAAAQKAWEADAVGRLQLMLGRGLEAGVAQVLAEHPERAANGPIVVYDAWVAWRAGDLERARGILAAAPPVDGSIGRDRTVLAARLALAAGDPVAADALLAQVEPETRWQDRPSAILDATTVTAARVRLSIDLDAELALWRRFQDDPRSSEEALQHLPAADVVLPLLARHLSRTGGYESLGERLQIPMSPDDGQAFVARIAGQRRTATPDTPPMEILPVAPPPPVWPAPEPDPAAKDGRSAGTDADTLPTHPRVLAILLEAFAARRWSIVANGPFLARACDALLSATGARDPQPLAVGGTLGAFAGNEWAPFRLFHPSVGPIDQVLRRSALEQLPILDPPPTVRQLEHALDFLDAAAKEWTIPGRPDLRPLREATADGIPGPRSLAARSAAAKDVYQVFVMAGPALEGIGAYLLSPDPLDVLVRRVLGIPDQLAR